MHREDIIFSVHAHLLKCQPWDFLAFDFFGRTWVF